MPASSRQFLRAQRPDGAAPGHPRPDRVPPSFEWAEGNPTLNFLRRLVFGQGQLAPVTREILRRREPDRSRRPHMHAG